MNKPLVFVIIVNYNGGRFLPKCLETLKKQTFKQFQLVVVDNASTDGSVETVKELFINELKKKKNKLVNSLTRNKLIIKLLKNSKNLGFPAAANQGIKYVLQNGANYLVLLGFDTRVDKNWLAELVKTARSSPQAGIIQSKILFYPSGKVQSLGNKITPLGFGFPSPRPQKQIDYASGASMLVKRQVFEKIGFFDEKLMFMEDLDFGWRARKAGFKILLSPTSQVYHQYEFFRYKKKFYFLERSRKLVLVKNQDLGKLLLLLPVFLLAEVGIFFLALFSGWFLDKIKAELYFWQNLSAAIKQRRKLNEGFIN